MTECSVCGQLYWTRYDHALGVLGISLVATSVSISNSTCEESSVCGAAG